PIAGKIFPRCAYDTNWIDTHVVVKSRVLDRQDCVFHYWRNLFVLERNALFKSKLSNHRLAVVSIDPRDYAWPISRKRCHFVRRSRIIELISGNDPRQATGSKCQKQDCREPKSTQNVLAFSRRSAQNF